MLILRIMSRILIIRINWKIRTEKEDLLNHSELKEMRQLKVKIFKSQ
jgi:hypothetical protein